MSASTFPCSEAILLPRGLAGRSCRLVDDRGAQSHGGAVAVLVVAEEVHKDQGALVRFLTAADHAGNGDGVAALDRPQELEVDGPGVVEDRGSEKTA